MNNSPENLRRPLRMELPDGTVGTHTSRVNQVLYDVYRLRNFSEELPVEIVDVENFMEATEEGLRCWNDAEGNSFGPYELLRDWESALENPLYTEHVKKILDADLSYPIWIYGNEYHIIDGMHRLVKAIITKEETIKCQRWENLPEDAVVEN